MLTMSQINHIKDLSNCGYRISEISKETGSDPKTIRKSAVMKELCIRFDVKSCLKIPKMVILDNLKQKYCFKLLYMFPSPTCMRIIRSGRSF